MIYISMITHIVLILYMYRERIIYFTAYIDCILYIIGTDLDECVTGTHDCDQECSNTNGGFQCGCYHGYQLDGSSCISKFWYCWLLVGK